MVKIPEVVYNSNLKKHLMQNPKFARKIAGFKVKEVYKDEFFANSPPSIFIGSKLYPAVNVGILSPAQKEEDVWLYDSQRYWADHDYDIYDILEFRSSLINSRFRAQVKDARNSGRFLDIAREIGMSSKPVDVEVKLKKKIKLRIQVDDTAMPIGGRGSLLNAKIVDNPKISQYVDKVYFDSDMKAVEGMNYLSKHGYDEQALSQFLTIGIMGKKKRRVFVPTRWSITAVDDMLGKEMLKRIRTYNEIDDYRLYSGHFLGNHYFVLLFPEMMQYELFETYLPGSFWNPGIKIEMAHDYEGFKGRTNYASNTVGGYYAARLGVLELLEKEKKQASALVIRFETPDYWAGLGVWVVRESARKTMKGRPEIFDSKEKLLSMAKEIIFNRFGFDLTETLKMSELLKNYKKQRKLIEF